MWFSVTMTSESRAWVSSTEQDHTLGCRLMTQLNRLITATLTTFVGA